MQIIGERVQLTTEQEVLLAMACGAAVQPERTVEGFGSWLANPHCDHRPALEHGARLLMAEHFSAAFAQGGGSANAGGRVWCVTRHPGALAWLHSEGIRPNRVVAHLEPDDVAPGDVVVGILPLGLAADLSERGVRCLHVNVRLGAADRGRELDAAAMRACGAQLEEFVVHRGGGIVRPT